MSDLHGKCVRNNGPTIAQRVWAVCHVRSAALALMGSKSVKFCHKSSEKIMTNKLKNMMQIQAGARYGQLVMNDRKLDQPKSEWRGPWERETCVCRWVRRAV